MPHCDMQYNWMYNHYESLEDKIRSSTSLCGIDTALYEFRDRKKVPEGDGDFGTPSSAVKDDALVEKS